MSNYTLNGNKNYAAEAVHIHPGKVIEFPELQNLVGYPWAGYTALISKSMIGTDVVMFPAESQLSEGVAQDNNLYAKREWNADTSVKGYLGKNRRVKALRLRGVLSSAVALSAEAFGNPPNGTVFDTVNGVEISRKYVPPVKESDAPKGQNTAKLWRRVTTTYLPEHYETGQYWREGFKFGSGDQVVVTQKLHGSSVRIAHTYAERKLNWFERLLSKVGVPIKTFDFDYVGGSRKVIKDPNNPSQQHFYGEGNDIWTEAALKYGPLLPKGVIVYGELVGYVTGTSTPIQSGYTYRLAEGENELYVYRVAIVQEDGGLYDLPWRGVQEFCNDRGLKWVPELWNGFVTDIDPDFWVNKNFLTYHNAHGGDVFNDTPVPLSSESPCDEGVVVRRDGITPLALKIKSPDFYLYESVQLDKM